MTADAGAWDLDAGRGVVARLIGEDRAAQIELVAARPDGNEYLLVDRADGNVRIEANTRSPLLAGVNAYLQRVARVNASWNGDSLDQVPRVRHGDARSRIGLQELRRVELLDRDDPDSR